VSTPTVRVLAEASEAARHCAETIAEVIERRVATTGRAAVAFSGGSSPNAMFDHLAGLDLPWSRVHVFQVDERFVPLGMADRNLTELRNRLTGPARIPPDHVHPMPVDSDSPHRALATYAAELMGVCGNPPVLDCVHLGLGEDGHTASLFPGDPALEVSGSPLAVSGVHHGHRRMTLTFEVINRSRSRVWLVVGPAKVDALDRLLSGDPTIPASSVEPEHSVIFCDRAARPPGPPRSPRN